MFCIRHQYQRCHRDAALSLSAAVEGGAVPRPEQRRRPSMERSATNPESSSSSTAAAGTASGSNSNSVSSGSSSSTSNNNTRNSVGSSTSNPNPPPPALRKRAMSATLLKVREAMPSSAGNKKDLVQWFLPTEKNRKEALIESAQAAADAAEEARKACLACWETLRSSIYSAIQVGGRVGG